MSRMLRIIDQASIAEVMNSLIKRYPPQDRLARKLDVSQSTISRLKGEDGPANRLISLTLYNAVRQLITDDDTLARKWARGIGLSREGKEAAATYFSWLDICLQSLRYGSGSGWVEEPSSALRLVSGEEWRQSRDRSFERLRRKLAEEIRNFRASVSDGKYDKDRVDLAIDRVIAPLLDFERTGGVERRWTEMTPAELRAFVKAGFAQEEILLNRPDDGVAMHLAAGRVHRPVR